MFELRLSAAGLLLFCSVGCATVGRSPAQTVLVASEPAGATVVVGDVPAGTTPALLSLRRKDKHTIGVTADGYLPATVELAPRTGYDWLFGNLLLFHPAVAGIGLAVDLASGAHRSLPASAHIRLDTDAGAPPRAASAVWQPVPLGAVVRVRLHPPQQTRHGVLVDIQADTLVLQNDGSAALRFPRDAITSMDVAIGNDRRAGMLRGAAIGAVPGCVLAYYWGASGGGFDSDNGAWACMLIGVPAGAIAGAVTGFVVAPRSWLRVLPR